jgi:hypothetical protein
MKRIIPLLIVVFVLASCMSAGSGDPNATQSEAYATYETWKQVNTATISGDQTGVLGKAHEGSAGFREVFVNDIGEATSAGAAALPYPTGSIIVKESYKNKAGEKGSLTSVTIMVKREMGYDPENGDWEYIMLSGSMKKQGQGALGACISCHAAAENDFVFTDTRK